MHLQHLFSVCAAGPCLACPGEFGAVRSHPPIHVRPDGEKTQAEPELPEVFPCRSSLPSIPQIARVFAPRHYEMHPSKGFSFPESAGRDWHVPLWMIQTGTGGQCESVTKHVPRTYVNFVEQSSPITRFRRTYSNYTK